MKIKDVAIIVLIVILFLGAAYIGGLRGQASYDRANREWQQTVIENRNN